MRTRLLGPEPPRAARARGHAARRDPQVGDRRRRLPRRLRRRRRTGRASRPGTRGILNALSPQALRLGRRSSTSTRSRRCCGRTAATTSWSPTARRWSSARSAQAGAVPGWPGEDVFPPQPMVTQIRARARALRRGRRPGAHRAVRGLRPRPADSTPGPLARRLRLLPHLPLTPTPTATPTPAHFGAKVQFSGAQICTLAPKCWAGSGSGPVALRRSGGGRRSSAGARREPRGATFTVPDVAVAADAVRAAGGRAGDPSSGHDGRTADATDDQGAPFRLRQR